MFQLYEYHKLNLLNKKFKVISPHGFDMENTGLTIYFAKRGKKIRGSDFSNEIIHTAQLNATHENLQIYFKKASIYELEPQNDDAELVICCEVLEHLKYPTKALEILSFITKPYLLVSVPYEPIWRILNMVRFEYLSNLGNTPGHINHWSKKSFLNLLNQYFDVLEIRTPLPWLMALCRSKNYNSMTI